MKRIRFLIFVISVLTLICGTAFSLPCGVYAAKASDRMPFYGLNPEYVEMRSQFYTSYTTSSEERKSNIKLAAKSINGTLVDVGGEFSFNRTVGERTLERGYKSAKIIVGGRFVDGVGGGVCQVSTTLYNAILLGGLKITEYHPHSLPVSYIAPSFDAMVNSGSADLKFINDTDNPVLIFAVADDATLRISVYGEPLREKYSRQSVVNSYIPAPETLIISAKEGEYPDLFEGERKVINYGKQGIVSEGFLVKTLNGKPVSVIKIRSDRYGAMQGLVVEGCEKRPPEPAVSEEEYGALSFYPCPECFDP